MKKGIAHIAIINALTIALLFGQVGIHFFHKHPDNAGSIQNTTKHSLVDDSGKCVVCALDVFNHSFIEQSATFYFCRASQIPFIVETLPLTGVAHFCRSDRAPPAIC